MGLLVSAAVEVGVYFGIKAAYEGGQTVAITVIGCELLDWLYEADDMISLVLTMVVDFEDLPTAFIFVGFWPQFWEIYSE